MGGLQRPCLDCRTDARWRDRWLCQLAMDLSSRGSHWPACRRAVPARRCGVAPPREPQHGRSGPNARYLDARPGVHRLHRRSSLGWGHPATIGCLAAAGCLFVCFLFALGRVEQPLLPLAIFRSHAFSAAAAAAIGMTFGMYAMLFLMPLYLQTVAAATAPAVGVQMLPM